MWGFCVLSEPYVWFGKNTVAIWRVQALEFAEQLLHDDGQLYNCVSRSSSDFKSTADFASVDKAYIAINDYYIAHGEITPYIRVHGKWQRCATAGGGQTTPASQVMEFE